jgi:phosphatidate phosphatase LPIN
MGHVLNMIGRDWTHLGVAKLYTEIVSNGYHILYLTSRSVGLADTTRNYLKNVVQDNYRLPKGPTIMSPDRTMAALRREVYLRKPEVFKMACLRDILNLFGKNHNPFYAGFGNRLTDALSYRSVNIPSTRIFTINTNAEVSLDLLTLNKYKSSYVSMREIVDHFFPPISLMVQGGGEDFTDFNFWRDRPLELDDFSGSESDDTSNDDGGSIRSEDEGSETLDDEDVPDDMRESFISRATDEETLPRQSFDSQAQSLDDEGDDGELEYDDRLQSSIIKDAEHALGRPPADVDESNRDQTFGIEPAQEAREMKEERNQKVVRETSPFDPANISGDDPDHEQESNVRPVSMRFPPSSDSAKTIRRGEVQTDSSSLSR